MDVGDWEIIKQIAVDFSCVGSLPSGFAACGEAVMPTMTMNFSAVATSANPDPGYCGIRLTDCA